MPPDCPLINVGALSGLMNLANIGYFFAIVVGAICVLVIVWKLFGILKDIPAVFWEIVLYGASIALMASPYWVPEAPEWMKITGCLLFGGSILFTGHAHELESNTTAFWAILTVLYGGVALFYGSEPVGFLAVIALLSLAGFSVVGGGLCIALGYEDEDKLPGGTLIATALTGTVLTAKFLNLNLGPFAVFMPGAIWIGSIVAGLGFLIIASKWYGFFSDDRRPNYVLMQIVALAVYGAGIFFGAVTGSDPVMYISAVFLAIYLVEKPHEIDTGVLGHAIFGLIGAVAIGYGATWLQGHMTEVNAYLEAVRQ